jgi:hypothetical protein
MRRFLTAIVFAVLLCVSLRAGEDAKPRPKLTDEVQSLVDQARAAAPEIFAYTIVKLVESGKIPQRELQVELLEDAFHSASRAVEPVRLIAIPGTPPDTREIFRSKAGELGLDAISLQSRILRNLLTVDRTKARELFGQMAHPALDPRPCEDPLVADGSPYYGVAAAIAQSAYTAAEKDRGLHVQFLMGLLSSAKAPIEVAALANAIEDVAFTPQQWNSTFTVLGKKLEATDTDYRSFAISFNTLQGAVSQLAELARASQMNESAAQLLASFGKYISVQMTAPRCRPDIPLETGVTLSDAESAAIVRRGSPTAHPYFESEDSKSIGEHLRQMPRQPTSTELSDLLREFELWRPTGSDVDVLHQKATVLTSLLQMRTNTADHDRILRLCVQLLASSGAQRAYPAEWAWQVKSLAEALRSDAPPLLIYLASAFTSNGTSK